MPSAVPFLDGSPAVSSNAAKQGLGRKEYGAGTDPTEREWQPYMSVVRLIRMGSSGDNLESGDFGYGRRRTFLKTFGHWEYTRASLIEYPLSDTPTAGTGWQYPAGGPVGPGRPDAAAIGCTARPRAGAI